MSKETVQFAEMIRQAYARQQQVRQKPAVGLALYCERCCQVTTHSVQEAGHDEIYTCHCGNQQSYRVR